MKISYFIGYSGGRLDFNGARVELPVERVRLADRLGYYGVFTAESYGSDALTPLAYLAGQTKQIRLGTALMIIPARPPVAAATAVQTIDQLAGGGRFIAGLGTSGPQVVEGWYGEPWGKPVTRMREYIAVMRKAFARQEPMNYQGKEFNLPYRGPGESGFAKPLRSFLHMDPSLPIWMGCGGEASVRLCGEVADGWIPQSFLPHEMAKPKAWIEEGFRRAGGGKSWKDFEIHAIVPTVVSDDVSAGLRKLKRQVAMYVGGMGAKEKNFHKDRMVEHGHADVAERLQELVLAGRLEEAIDAVPDEVIDATALVGPPARIRERYRPWADSIATGLIIRTEQDEAIRLMAEISEAVTAKEAWA